RAPRHARPVRVPARPPGGAHRRGADPALAPGVVHLPEAARHVGEPALHGGGRLRRHRRRRGRHHRKHPDRAHHPRAQRLRPSPPTRPSALATRWGFGPPFSPPLIIIAASLPIFMLQRVEGRIFAPMANTVVAALIGALLFSVILIPVLASLVYRRPVRHRESPLLRWASRAYEPTLAWGLAHPWLTLGGAAAMLAATVALMPRLGSEFLPELNEGALYVTFTLPSNVSLSEGRKIVPRLTNIFLAQPQADEIMSQLGRPEDGTDATLTNNLEFFLKLKEPAEWPPDTRSIGEVINSISQAVSVVPG